MLNLFWHEVLLTQSPLKFGLAKESLKKENIPYKTKIINSGNNSRQQGSFLGQLGERPELEILYYLYVKKEYFERANFIIKNLK